MPRGGLIFVRCVPAAITAHTACVLFILVASSLSSLQSVSASRLPLSRDLRGDNNVRFGLAEDKPAGGTAAPGSGASASAGPKGAPAGKAQPEKAAAAAPTPGDKKEAPAPAPQPAKSEPGKPEGAKQSEGPAPKADAGPTTGTPAGAPKATASPAGQPEGAGGDKEKAASGAGGAPAASSGQAQDQPQGPGPVTPRAGERGDSGSTTVSGTSGPVPTGTGVSGGGTPPATTDGNKTDAAHSLRAPISATLALVLSGCALTIL